VIQNLCFCSGATHAVAMALPACARVRIGLFCEPPNTISAHLVVQLESRGLKLVIENEGTAIDGPCHCVMAPGIETASVP
jgi:hypothetical protein